MSSLIRETNQDDSLCTHPLEWLDEARISEGENLAGKIVRCIMQEALCTAENLIFLRRRSLTS